MNEHKESAYAVARQIWDSIEDADTFMTTPHTLLNSKTPVEVAETAEGARRVIDILRNLYWGLPS